MISSRGKRKMIYNGNVFYWFVRKNAEGIIRIHILSGDKKINIEYPPFDTEIPVTPKEIKRILVNYFNNNPVWKCKE